MLSLKASRADNFYYGTVEEEQAKEKKKKHDKKKNPKQFDEIKFETPFTIICKKCEKYIYKGVRFKSQRKRAGYYLNTPFYSFTIFCPGCSNQIIIETNPKDCSYDIIEGARKKCEEYKNVFTEKGKGNVDGIDLEEVKQNRTNPFLLLEKRALERKKEEEKKKEKKVDNTIKEKGEDIYLQNKENDASVETKQNLLSNSEQEENQTSGRESERYTSEEEEDLEEVIKKQYLRNKILKDDFRCNRNLRNQLRNLKKEKIQQLKENKKNNIFIKLLQDPYEDEKEKYKSLHNKCKSKIKMQTNFIKNKLLVKKSSIFDKKYVKHDHYKTIKKT